MLPGWITGLVRGIFTGGTSEGSGTGNGKGTCPQAATARVTITNAAILMANGRSLSRAGFSESCPHTAQGVHQG